MKKLCFLLAIMSLSLITEAQTCQALFSYWSMGGARVYFNDSSNNYSGNIFHWDFGDSHTGSGQHVQHQYQSSGTYNVCLTISDTTMGCHDIYCSSINVHIGCHASFTHQITGKTAKFWDVSTNYLGNTYFWDFDDGNTSSSQNPQHTYSLAGRYNVSLTISDSACNSYHENAIVIYDCHASFIPSISGSTVNFSSDTTSHYLGTIYLWTFGDGNSGNGRNVQHTYSSAGTYNVCLTSADSTYTCFDTYCDSVTVTIDCQASFNYNVYGNTVSFTDASVNYSGNTYIWNFGEGNTATGKNQQHTYSSADTYNVCLTISDSSNNCNNTYCKSITIISYTCHAIFSHTISGSTVYFSDSSKNYFGNTFYWTFGDGNSGSGQYVQHTYSSSGTYNVSLSIIDTTTNCMDSVSHSIVILNNNAIYGQVFAGSNYALYGNVYLIVYNPNDSTLTAIDTIPIDSGGYTFTNFPNGSYLVKVALSSSSPYYSNYIPTYYGNVLFWNQASYLNFSNSQNTANISLLSGTNPGGPGFIGGKTSQGANAVLDPGDPIESVLILLLDDMDNPIQYDYSDAIGSFDFDDIALGTYKIYAEVLGKTTFPATVTIDETKSSISDVKIIIGKKEVTNYIGEDNFEFIRNVSDIYPNPGKDEMFLDITVIKHTNITVTVYNELGEFVHSNTIELGKGSNIVPIKAHNWASGVYYLQISSSEGDQVFRKYVKF